MLIVPRAICDATAAEPQFVRGISEAVCII